MVQVGLRQLTLEGTRDTTLFISCIHISPRRSCTFLHASKGHQRFSSRDTPTRSHIPSTFTATLTPTSQPTKMVFSFISTAVKSAPIPAAFAIITALETIVTIVMQKMRPKVPAEAADIFSPGIAAGLTAFYFSIGRKNLRQSTFLVVVSAWAIRLASFSYARIRHGFHDSRIDQFRGSSGARFWLVMHSLWIFLSPLPVWVSMTAMDGLPISALDWALAALSGSGLAIETIADMQKASFRAENNAKPDEERQNFCENGLFSLSRFPNYFGEWLIWTSLSGLAFRATKSWTRFLLPLSPIFTFVVLQFSMKIAISSIRKRCSDEEFRQWQSISLFVPWPRRR